MANDVNKQDMIVSGSKSHTFLFKKAKIALLLGMAVLLVVAMLGAIPVSRHFFNGYIGVTTPQKAGSCSGNLELISRYNNVVRQKGVTELASIAKEVRDLPQYTSDPTCVYISMVADYGSNSTAGEQEGYTNLKALKADGKDVSSKIDDGMDRKAVYQIIQQHINESKQKYYGQG